jgi:hypothetical protein
MSRIDARGVAGPRWPLPTASTLTLALHLLSGCSKGGYNGPPTDGSVRPPRDLSDVVSRPDLLTENMDGSTDFGSPADLAVPHDLAVPSDLAVPPDLTVPPDFATPPDLTPSGPINGGPCMSGASGATAFRVHWTDSGGRATVSYDVHGLPDKTRWKVGVYGYGPGFTPQFVDPFLGSGGLQLDSSDFIDVELSTVGVSRITSASVSIFGRSYSTGSSGSFNWMTVTGSGATPLNHVSNVAPYRWYSGDATAAISPSDRGILLRIKAGGSSNSLVVNRLELCINAS